MTNAERIRQAVIDNATLCEFSYKGKSGNIDPGYLDGDPESFLLWFDGSEKNRARVRCGNEHSLL